MLILTFVLLILGWLRVFDAGFATILIVSTRYPSLLKLTLASMALGQISLTSMTTCAARFAIVRLFRASAARFFHASARPDDDKLELTHQEGCESCEDGLSQRSGTRPGTRPDMLSYNLFDRGVVYEDDRIFFKKSVKRFLVTQFSGVRFR